MTMMTSLMKCHLNSRSSCCCCCCCCLNSLTMKSLMMSSRACSYDVGYLPVHPFAGYSGPTRSSKFLLKSTSRFCCREHHFASCHFRPIGQRLWRKKLIKCSRHQRYSVSNLWTLNLPNRTQTATKAVFIFCSS